ncbi:MAG: hypothetical protein MUE69_33105 [Myxococcota bacterium]|nr:hypothetical protein [Myxococcota bacterium]
MNGRRKTRSHRIGPGGIRCICCRPANKSMYLEELHESLLGIETRELEEDVLWGERERGAA